jgi:hypothetical protein
VRLSLAQTGHWLRHLGRVGGGLQAAMPGFDDIASLAEQHASGFGMLTTIRHAARMSATPVRWDLPAMPLGSHAPAWLARAGG